MSKNSNSGPRTVSGRFIETKRNISSYHKLSSNGKSHDKRFRGRDLGRVREHGEVQREVKSAQPQSEVELPEGRLGKPALDGGHHRRILRGDRLGITRRTGVDKRGVELGLAPDDEEQECCERLSPRRTG